ncbi:MAG: patatin-like phospholipase family protein [Gemmataceae bacterium]
MAWSRHLGLALAALLLACVPACKSRSCVPEPIALRHDLIDLCGGAHDRPPAPAGMTREVMDACLRRAAGHHPPGARPYQFLALSGGGLWGSFGVGVLNGWTASGTRPVFDVVTGISVGSIQATAAFLGPQYDEQLREDTVGVERKDILRRRPLAALLCAPSVFDADRLARRLERGITPQMLREVAEAHAQGRRLYVGTCNLDTGGLVIWDMGLIATRGTPEALDLYRKVILASASIPGVMPPVELPVEIDGKRHTELHVDGATADDIFFRSFMVLELNRRAGNPSPFAPPGSRLTIINNGKLIRDPKCVKPKLAKILVEANDAVLTNKRRDEMSHLFLHCLETAVDYRLTMVPDDVKLSSTTALGIKRDDQELLYALGNKIGLDAAAGGGWRDTPPGHALEPEALPRSGLKFATPPGDGCGRPSPAVIPPAATGQTSASSPPTPGR